jgi:hypothetical protein
MQSNMEKVIKRGLEMSWRVDQMLTAHKAEVGGTGWKGAVDFFNGVIAKKLSSWTEDQGPSVKGP